jgi:ATP-dependent helicase HrpA
VLAENRLREWDDVHAQLAAVTDGLGWDRGRSGADYASVHKAILCAFVDYIAEHEDRGTYRGMHGVRSRIFPGSAAAAGTPKWIVAAEHVSTERNFLRTVARIDPRWIEQVARHLLKRTLGEPRWDGGAGRVVAPETLSVFGLVISAGRQIDFGPVDPAKSREIFIRDALASGDGELGSLDFVRHNAEQLTLIHDWEARRRSRDLYVGDRALAQHYEAVLPADVRDRRSLLEWYRDTPRRDALKVDWRALVTRDVSAAIESDYPSWIECAGQRLALTYRYDPGDDSDGITLDLPVVLLDSVSAFRFDWLVPGLLRAKVLAMLRTLPKERRRPLVPLPDTVDAVLPLLEKRFGIGGLDSALAETLSVLGHTLPAGAFSSEALPAHLRLRVRLIAADGSEVAAGREFDALQREFGGAGSTTHAGLDGSGHGRLHTAWDFGELPSRADVKRFGTTLSLYPALVADGRGVRVERLPPGPSAERLHRAGVRRLLILALPQQTALLRGRVVADRSLLLAYHGIGTTDALVDDVLAAAAESAFAIDTDCRSPAAFRRVLESGRARYVECGEAVIAAAIDIVARHRELRRTLAALREHSPEAVADMTAQLDRLVCPGGLTAASPRWLTEIPRYLAAIGQRCESLRYRNTRDRQDLLLARKADRRWILYAESLPAGWPLPPSVEHYRWLSEELRVSLFAQALGTATQVSGKRLERYWQEHVG